MTRDEIYNRLQQCIAEFPDADDLRSGGKAVARRTYMLLREQRELSLALIAIREATRPLTPEEREIQRYLLEDSPEVLEQLRREADVQ
jgi:hypothetical protein